MSLLTEGLDEVLSDIPVKNPNLDPRATALGYDQINTDKLNPAGLSDPAALELNASRKSPRGGGQGLLYKSSGKANPAGGDDKAGHAEVDIRMD